MGASYNPLMFAFIVRSIPAIILLMAASFATPASAQFKPESWYNAAHAVSRQNISGLRSMLAKGDSPDAVDGDGRPAIIWAVQVNSIEALQLLIDAKAKIDARDRLGATALYTAAGTGNLDMVRILLEAQASVDLPNRQGITPLMVAAGRGTAPVVRELLKAGADPTKQDFSGRDAKGWAAQPQIRRVIEEASQKKR